MPVRPRLALFQQLLTLLFVLPGVVLLIRDARRREKDAARSLRTPEVPRTRPGPTRTTWFALGLFLIGFLIGYRPRPLEFGLTLLAIVGGLAGIFLIFLLFAVLKSRDPVAQRALRRSSEGDPRGAIADLREAIESRGPRVGWLNALGCIHHQEREFSEALACFDRAAAIDGEKVQVQSNRAVALMKLGRPDEAVAAFEDVRARAPLDLNLALIYARSLGEARLTDEGRVQLARVEMIRSNWRMLPKQARGYETQQAECVAIIEGLAAAPGEGAT